MSTLGQKEQHEIREDLYSQICDTFHGAVRVVDGLAVPVGDGYAVIKVVVKKDTFDINDAIDEYNEKRERSTEREAERAAKAKAKDEAKAKREAEKAEKDAAKAKKAENAE